MIKKWWKIIIPLVFLLTIIFVISLKSLNPYKPSFLNYAQYCSPIQIEKIKKNYSYKEYKSIDEFNYSIENNKAISGIGPDYNLVNLIQKNKVKKIDFKINFGIENPLIYYSEPVKKQMEFYDQFLINIDNDNDEKRDYFWEYTIPYFINTKVISVNTKKTNFDIIEDEFKNMDYFEILSLLKTKGAKIFGWVNTKLENTTIGSNKENDYSTKITLDNYKSLIDNFQSIVEESTNYKLNDSMHHIFDDDSDIILQSIINPKSPIEVASIYNGDALDAYYSEDNFMNVETVTVKTIKPINSISILDGLVISNSLNDEEANSVVQNLYNDIFKGIFMNENEVNNEITTLGGEFDFTKLSYSENIDYVNYTPISKGTYEFFYNNYFLEEDGTQDEVARNIFAINLSNINPLYPVSDELKSSINTYFKEKLI